jgi:hypothetical protein
MFFLSLILGSLAGYCTFFLLGWVLIVLPVLFWSLWRFCSPAVFRRALLILTGIGLLALLLGWPILQEMLSRDSVVRDARFRPLLTWLSAPPIPLSFWLLAKMTSLIIVSCLFGNPLAILAWCSRRQIALSPLIFSVCTGIFLWGSLVACLGVVNDFVPKFGFFIALCGAFPLAFLRVRSRLINGFILGGLVGPLILLANMPRASLMLAKASPIAQVLDQQLDRENRPVLYIIGLEERIRRTPWLNYMPHNSRALFFVEAAELEDQGKNFLKSPRELPMLPPLESRLMNYFGQHTSYYLLTTPDRTREGKAPGSLLYQDRDFALFSVE